MKKPKAHTNKELAAAHIFPHGLSKEEKAAADKELLKFRTEAWEARTKEDILRDKLLQLRFLIEDSLASLMYDEEYDFGHFLSSYIQIIEKKQKEFAKEINI